MRLEARYSKAHEHSVASFSTTSIWEMLFIMSAVDPIMPLWLQLVLRDGTSGFHLYCSFRGIRTSSSVAIFFRECYTIMAQVKQSSPQVKKPGHKDIGGIVGRMIGTHPDFNGIFEADRVEGGRE